MASLFSRGGTLEALSVRDFRLLFIGLVAGQVTMPFQFIAQIFWVQATADEESRVLLVGALAATRGLGALSFGLVGGALADRFDRRRLLIATQSAALGVKTLIVLVMAVGTATTATFSAFYTLTFTAAALAAIDVPTRQALVPSLLGPRLTPGGYSLNTAGIQFAIPAAMFISGLAVHELGFAGAYAAGSSGHVIQVLALALMAYRRPARDHHGDEGSFRPLKDIGEGARYVRADPTILWVITLVFLVVAIGSPAVANLGPTWITTEVDVPVRYFGFVAVTWGIGAFLASAALARAASRLRRWGLVLGAAAMVFALSFIVFSIPTVPTAIVGNLGLGAGIAATSVAGVSIVQHLTPAHLRGRVMGVLFLGRGLAQLATFPLAAAAQVVSLRTLFPALAITQLVLIMALLWLRPVIARARVAPSSAETPVPTEL
jgi:MFS family permease